jgi:hypothetical protein
VRGEEPGGATGNPAADMGVGVGVGTDAANDPDRVDADDEKDGVDEWEDEWATTGGNGNDDGACNDTPVGSVLTA